MREGKKAGESLSLTIMILYLVPLLAIVGYSLWLPETKAFGIFSLGLLFSVIGSICVHTLIRRWEKGFQPPEQLPAPVEEAPLPQDETEKDVEILSLIKSADEYKSEMEFSLQTLTHENQALIDQITHKESLLEQSELLINELRATEDRKQQRINQLETKVRDLSYEIKTLLHLTEIPDSPKEEEKKSAHEKQTTPFRINPAKKSAAPEDASDQLKRCINIAQKMTGASHYSTTNSRFRGIPVDNFALDLRCLFDSLRSENSYTVLFYSPKENKLLFANNEASKLTGWSPDKFVQNFHHIIQEGQQEWAGALKQLASQSQAKVRLILKSREGEDVLVHGLLGTIPTGIFRNHIVVVLFSGSLTNAL